MKHNVSKSFVGSVEQKEGGVRLSNVKRLLSKVKTMIIMSEVK